MARLGDTPAWTESICRLDQLAETSRRPAKDNSNPISPPISLAACLTSSRSVQSS